MSVSRRSECHETSRCNCRFGCSSAAAASGVGTAAAAADAAAAANPVVSSLTVVAFKAAVGERSTAATIPASARSGCGCEGEREEEEDGAAAAVVGRCVECKDVHCVLRKSLHGGSAAAAEDADADTGADSENVGCSGGECECVAGTLPAPASFQTLLLLPPGASPNDADADGCR